MAGTPRPPRIAGTATPARLRMGPEVEVRLSARRRTTASASWESGRIVVQLPARLRVAEREAMVEDLVERILAQNPLLYSDDRDLQTRAQRLADLYYDGVRPDSVRWVSNQHRRWGSCTPARRQIRITDRLRPVPDWVLDAVLAHEVAHLIEPSHSPRFQALAQRYPRLQEADVFLAGFAVGLEAASGRESV